ncbi:MAG: cupredoxin domain-containing protein [Actinobacteria bacterium]|nr:cupredoxin domain-containing protein [Actinomycetota bacterium]MCG2806963.1 cupredoxin domain-containing protein [Coriobacteriia bacterium]
MSTHKKHSNHTNHSKKTPPKAAQAPAPLSSASESKPSGSSKTVAAVAVKPNANVRMALLLVLVVAAFFGAYRFAQAAGSATADQTTGVAGAVAQASSAIGSATGSGGGGGCCGGGGAPIEGAATVEGNIQKISIDMSSGSYNPNVIKLKAGVPTEITFGQSSGCTAEVVSSDLGFQEDLSSGPRVVKLQGLAAGTYNFACGMNMVTGQIVVE